MNQIADILKLASTAQRQSIDAVLATVVRTEGSAYRRAGAMMLICADGRSVGMISGGCLEPHIIKRAFWLTRSGATVQVYQTGEDIEYTENGQIQPPVSAINDMFDEQNIDADELNFGLGCNGRVHVLFERLTTAMPLLDMIGRVRHTQQPIMIATLIRSNNCLNNDSQNNAYNTDNNHIQIGTRIHLEDYRATGAITTIDANHQRRIASDIPAIDIDTVEVLSKQTLCDKPTNYTIVKNNSTTTEWLVQRLQPQMRLLVCGAGNDVMPLVTMAKLQDWHVTVIDSRTQYATAMRFPLADAVRCLPLADHDTLLELSRDAAVALMSHSLSQDRARLAVLLKHATHYKYLGQLGPRYRTERLIREISATTTHPATLAAGVRTLHYPIGYKLGGDGPEALALGIMAQINAVMHEQAPPVGFLDAHPSLTEITPLSPKSKTDKNKTAIENGAVISRDVAMSLL